MLKFILLLVFFFTSFFQQNLIAQKVTGTYINPYTQGVAVNHNKVAILPFTYVLSEQAIENEAYTKDEIDAIERQTGVAFQRAFYQYFLEKEIQASLNVEFLNTDSVNIKLHELRDDDSTGIDIIGKFLDVDAIVKGKIFQPEYLSNLENSLLFIGAGGLIAGMARGTKEPGKVLLTLYDVKTQQPIWGLTFNIYGKQEINVLVKRVMSGYLKTLPYYHKN